MAKILQFLTFLTLLFFSFSLSAQINERGSTFPLGNRCYRLTEDSPIQAGTIWSQEKINLNQSFDILAKVNFGTNNNSGGDGMAFAFSKDNTYLDNTSGSSLGLYNLNPSLILEMDTYNNSEKNDPLNDHMAIHKNGSFVHNTTNNLSPAVNFFSGFSLNVEDGDDHILRITWSPKDTQMVVYFDCSQRISLKYNIVKRIFGNDPNVYWGFSGACGTNSNKQTICILRCSSLDNYNEKTLCEGAQPLAIEASYGNSFLWAPANSLSASSIRTPTANPISTTTYIANVQHECSLNYKDTVKIIRPRLYPNTWIENATLCDDKTVVLNATAPDAKTYSWSTGESTPSITVKTSGTYVVSISDGICIKVLDSDVTVNTTPKFSLGADIDVCENIPVNLDATVPGATYKWSNGSITPKITVSKSGNYVATVTSAEGCKYQDAINVKIRPSSKYTDTQAICEGNSYTFQGNKYAVDTTLNATLLAANGCDSFYTLNIKVLKKSFGSQTQRICEGSQYDFYGQKLTKSGIYKKTLAAANGCDSIFSLTLNVINSDSSKVSKYICKNDSYSIGNQSFNKDGLYSVKLKNSIGCDSFVLLTLTVDKGLGYTYNDTICNGFAYSFDGKQLTKPGDYNMILKNQNACDSVVTVKLFVKNAPPVTLSTSKKILCDGDETTINASGTYKSYLWSVQTASGNSFLAKEAGLYRVSVTDETGCVGYDSIQINKSSPMKIALAKKTPSCSGYSDGQLEIKKIEGGIAPYTYSLDGVAYATKLIFNNLKEGSYTIHVRDSANCEAKIIESLQNPIPKRIQISDQSRNIKLGDSTIVTIVPTFNDIATITWLPNSSVVSDKLEAWLKPVRSTRYTVTVADSLGCKFSDTVKVSVDGRLNLFMPTVFSANFDGTNDDFRPFAGSVVAKILSFRVFDRWGNQVFEALDLKPNDTVGWDGNFRDKPLVQGVYLYHVKVLKLNDDIEDVVGEVTLLR